MNPIIPTVGRVVYFTPAAVDDQSIIPDWQSGVCAALVTAVHNQNCVNLTVFDASGNQYARCSICHVSTVSADDDVKKYDTWDWMPYQKGQAAKTEELEQKLVSGSAVCGEAAIESEIQAKGLNAPRLTPADIDAAIDSETYTFLPSGRVTICEMTLKNGFVVLGESSCISKENFDAEIGKKIAYQNAREKIWQLEGYLLRQRLHDEEFSQQTTPQQRVLLEKHDLDEKIEKLSAFLSKPKPDFVSEAQWGLMSLQIHHMKHYQEVLRDRLIDFGVIAEPLSPHNTINS